MKLTLGEWTLGHQKSSYSGNIQFALYRVLEDGVREVLQLHGPEMRVQRIEPGEEIKEPSFFLERDHMQAFMDTLWELGARPKDRRFEAEIAIKHQHLQDMRKIAFNALGIKEE